jgi:hypothetical protein
MLMSSRRRLRSLKLVAGFPLGLLGGLLATLIGSLRHRGKPKEIVKPAKAYPILLSSLYYFLFIKMIIKFEVLRFTYSIGKKDTEELRPKLED